MGILDSDMRQLLGGRLPLPCSRYEREHKALLSDFLESLCDHGVIRNVAMCEGHTGVGSRMRRSPKNVGVP
jgi:hypothetical protein